MDSASSDAVICRDLTKDFGGVRALDGLSFTAPMGAVTGFVGVNGAGKTTAMRIALGLVAPTSGTALIKGARYADLREPRRMVGAVLDGPGAHPGQSGRAYLEILAAAAGIARRRIDEVLEEVGLAEHGHRRVGGYSLGMRQRLALAGALLGDPPILILDEPANGLDPLGMRWMRTLLRGLAADGRCVLVSSHQLGELEATADRIVMIDHGKLVAVEENAGVLDGTRATEAVVRTSDAPRLREVLEARGASVVRHVEDEQTLNVSGLSLEEVGAAAAEAGTVVYSLSANTSRLEELFFQLSGLAAQAAPDGKARGGV